jgi:hypothetical protein
MLFLYFKDHLCGFFFDNILYTHIQYYKLLSFIFLQSAPNGGRESYNISNALPKIKLYSSSDNPLPEYDNQLRRLSRLSPRWLNGRNPTIGRIDLDANPTKNKPLRLS